MFFPPSLLLCMHNCVDLGVDLCFVRLGVVGRSWHSQCPSWLCVYFCNCVAGGLCFFHVLHNFLPAFVSRSTCRIWIIQTTPMTDRRRTSRARFATFVLFKAPRSCYWLTILLLCYHILSLFLVFEAFWWEKACVCVFSCEVVVCVPSAKELQ
jgi:hypothetical protein